jgi:SAM-dependent methyltransferase
MPTVPPAPSRPSENEPHRHREVAESFGVDPERYDRTRPPYPDALIEAVVTAAPGSGLLDVGTGTGIAARQFRSAGCRVSGVEPDARMAGLARRDGIDVDVAAFETWDPAGRTFDAVVSGQAWHWIDPVAGAAKAARVLRPGGLLAVFWHALQLPPEVARAFAEAYQRAVPDSPFTFRPTDRAVDGYLSMCARAADGIRSVDGFGAPARRRFDWERTYTRDEWLDQLPTQGTLTRVTPEQRDAVLQDVGAAVDALGGSFTGTYATVAVVATRSGPN